jgi:hypothetical protein
MNELELKEYTVTVSTSAKTALWKAVYSLSKHKFIKNKIKKTCGSYQHTYLLMPGKYLLFSGDLYVKRRPKIIITLQFLVVSKEGIKSTEPFCYG